MGRGVWWEEAGFKERPAALILAVCHLYSLFAHAAPDPQDPDFRADPRTGVLRVHSSISSSPTLVTHQNPSSLTPQRLCCSIWIINCLIRIPRPLYPSSTCKCFFFPLICVLLHSSYCCKSKMLKLHGHLFLSFSDSGCGSTITSTNDNHMEVEQCLGIGSLNVTYSRIHFHASVLPSAYNDTLLR